MGCLASNPLACASIYRLKARSQAKPLPLAVASLDQLAQYVDITQIPEPLLAFWPGPLTLVLKALSKTNLAAQVLNPLGEVAIRISSHPKVRALTLKCESPLTVSSANLSGKDPPLKPSDLDQSLLLKMAQMAPLNGLLDPDLDFKTYTLPSTILRVKEDHSLEVLREGAIPPSLFRI